MHLPHKLIIKKEQTQKVKGVTKSIYVPCDSDVSCAFWGSRGGYADTGLSRDTNTTSYTVMIPNNTMIVDGDMVELFVNNVSWGDYTVRNPVPHYTRFGIAKSNIKFTAVKK